MRRRVAAGVFLDAGSVVLREDLRPPLAARHVLPPFLYTRPRIQITDTKVKLNAIAFLFVYWDN